MYGRLTKLLPSRVISFIFHDFHTTNEYKNLKKLNIYNFHGFSSELYMDNKKHSYYYKVSAEDEIKQWDIQLYVQIWNLTII